MVVPPEYGKSPSREKEHPVNKILMIIGGILLFAGLIARFSLEHFHGYSIGCALIGFVFIGISFGFYKSDTTDEIGYLGEADDYVHWSNNKKENKTEDTTKSMNTNQPQ